ncbi:MAG: SpaA isopeptide-forming pilin-related protein, partial [Oscillospiraceae bacterium]
MKNARRFLDKLISVLLVAVICLGLVPASIVNAAVEANINLEMSIKSGYTDSAPVLPEVQSGEPFYVYIRYAMNAVSSDDKYLAPTMRIELPNNVEVAPDGIRANNHIADDANGNKMVSLETVGGKTYVVYRFADELAAGSAATLSFQAKFKNMTTPPTKDGEPAPKFEATIEGSLIPRATGIPEEFASVKGEASVKVAASSNWGIFKTVKSSEFSNDKSHFEVSYDIAVNLLKDGVDPAAAAKNPTGDFYRAPDSFGRLEFDKFEISDILPQIGANSVIAKSGAELVEIGMYLPDGTKKPLDASQYTVTNDAYGDASSIAFSDKLYSTFTAADAAKLSYVSAGDSCNTKFYLTIKFPTTSYVSQINEPLKVFTFTNDAKLTYSLVGDNADQTVSDSASAELSLRENINDDFSITVKKIIQVGNKQFILDGNAVENGYGAASFMLYTDEKCTIPAQMYDRLNDTSSDVPTLVIDKDSKDGTVKFEHLRRGDYFLSENPCAGFHIESPVGVGGSANPIKITILADGTVNYNDGKIVKTAKGGSIDIINRADSDGVGIIEFVKKGTNSMGAQLALNGIEFQLYSIDADGKIADKPTKVCVSGINGIDGYVRFDGVKPGKYIIREVLLTDEQKAEYTALADVAVEAKSDTVVGVSNVFGSSDILMNRSDKGRFTIKKTDMADQPLQGANADIYFDTNNNSLLDATDEKAAENILLGTYESGPVKPGRYFVKETKAPDGYKLLTSPLTFEVSAMKSVEIALKNEKLGWLSIYKYGDWKSPDGKIQKAEIGLAGAEFEIFNDNNGSIGVSTGKTITTVIDATGKPSYDGAASVQLPSGTYWIVETKAPVGYTLDKTARRVEVQSGDSANGKAADNVYVYDGHSVIRVDNSSSDEFVRIQLTKIDKSNGRLIEGVTFKIWSSEDKSELKGVLTTDKNGVALSNPIKPGNYFIEETNTPDGYVPIGMLKGIKIENNKNIAITSGNGISVKGGETLGLLVQNEPYVSYSFTKIDSTSKKAIIDGKATFELYDGDPANGGKVIGAEKADSTGKVTFGGLVPNKQYWYREKVQPDGYVLSSAVQQFTAPSDNNQQSGQLPTFGNDHEIELVIEKTGVFDEVEKALDGADFLIYPSSVRSMPTLWQAQFDSDKAAAESANTVRTTAPTKGGKTSLKGLAPGGYWIVEKTAPTGYALEITPKFISIPAGGNTAVFQFNYRFADKANSGNLEIEKLNAITDEKMSGVTFTLYKNAAGGALGAAVAAKTTGADGKALWELLASGDYTLVETTAPDGFAKISDIINIKIEDGKTTRLTGADAIGNQPMGKIKIQKNALWYGVNGKDDIVLPLAGAEFEVYDKDGKVVATLITGADGTATSTWLADGTYTIKETKAPTGFTADAAVKTVTVKVTATEKVFSPADPFVNIHDGGKIRILKTDNANPANPLSGVKFNIWRVDDVNGAPKEIDTGGTKKTVNLILAATVTSDAKGCAVTDSLPVGQYYLEEIAAPFGYAYFNRWSGVVEVIASSVTDAAVENYPTVTGSGKKVNDAGKAVPNAYIGLFTDEAAAIKAATTEFTVNQLNGLIGKKYDGLTLKNAWDIVQCAKTGGDGSFKFVDLNTARTYYIVELIAPAGHVRDVNVRTITAQNGAFAMPVITNYRFGTIEIYKSYYMSGAQRPLAGAEFELYHAVLNSGKNDNDVKNELNKLWNKANSGLSIGTVVTNGSGSKMTGLVTSGTNGALSFKNLV